MREVPLLRGSQWIAIKHGGKGCMIRLREKVRELKFQKGTKGDLLQKSYEKHTLYIY